MELQQFKCKSCGNPLDVSSAVGGVLTCDFCGNTYPLPKEDTSDEVRAYLRAGEHDLDRNDFNGAYAAYDKARTLAPDEPEAYRGMALAESQVRYLKDEVNNRLQPICFSHDGKPFTGNENYKRALTLATPEQKADYRRKAEDIDYIRKQFDALRKVGENYDCFLCVKVTDDDGGKTDDYRAADEIYDLLKRRGYSPFFSERTIQNKTGADYEAEILYALYTCETMLVICREEKYLHTKWVQNEYTRFLKLVNDEEKESDSIATVFYGTPVERLPGRAGKLQGIDYRKPDAAIKIVEFVESHTPRARQKRQEAAMQKEREAEEIRKQMAEQRRAFEESQQRLQQEMESKLQSVQTVGGTMGGNTGASASVASLLKRANQEMEFNNVPSAREYFNKVLDIAPESCEAWWGLFLLDNNVRHENELKNDMTADLNDAVQDNRNYISAAKYSKSESTAVAKRIQAFAEYLDDPQTWWDAFLRVQACDALDNLLTAAQNYPKKYKEIANSAELKLAAKCAKEKQKSPVIKQLQELKTALLSVNKNAQAAIETAKTKQAEADKAYQESNRARENAQSLAQGATIQVKSLKSTLEQKVAENDKIKIPDEPSKVLPIFMGILLGICVILFVIGITKAINSTEGISGVLLTALPGAALLYGGWFPIMKIVQYRGKKSDHISQSAKKSAASIAVIQAEKELADAQSSLLSNQNALKAAQTKEQQCQAEYDAAQAEMEKLQNIIDDTHTAASLL